MYCQKLKNCQNGNISAQLITLNEAIYKKQGSILMWQDGGIGKMKRGRGEES